MWPWTLECKLVFGGSVFLTENLRQAGFQGQFYRPDVLPRPTGQGQELRRGLWTTRDGRGRKGQQVTSRARRQVLRSGAKSSLDAPRVWPVPRWHLRARVSTAGQNRNFLRPSGRARERGVVGHDTQTATQAGADYNSRHAAQGQGLQHPSDVTCRWTQTTTPDMRRRADVYNSYWSFLAARRGLTLAIPACAHKPWVWNLESSAVHV